MASPIPSFYRVFFTCVDPILSFFGVCATLFNPAFVLRSYAPTPMDPMAVETAVLVNVTTAFFASLAFLQFLLLRAKPNDVTVWKYLQFSTIIIDLGAVASLGRALDAQGRLSPQMWTADEAPHMIINGGLALLRIAFVLGIGMTSESRVKIS